MHFSITINAPAHVIWHVLWHGDYYKLWTARLAPGSRAINSFEAHQAYQFLHGDGHGLYGHISIHERHKHLVFSNDGIVKKGTKQPPEPNWVPSEESYHLEDNGNGNTLHVDLNGPESFFEQVSTRFPAALQVIKQHAEALVYITVEVQLNCTTEQAWAAFTEPAQITKWYFAADDWHVPAASTNLAVAQSFCITMAAKDGSFAFDLIGTYDEIITHEKISYHLTDKRQVHTTFLTNEKGCLLTQKFMPEAENGLDLQEFGWQAILNNLKKHCASIAN
jgi:uncharacterized protein YndB with AHSA1/START domain